MQQASPTPQVVPLQVFELLPGNVPRGEANRSSILAAPPLTPELPPPAVEAPPKPAELAPPRLAPPALSGVPASSLSQPTLRLRIVTARMMRPNMGGTIGAFPEAWKSCMKGRLRIPQPVLRPRGTKTQDGFGSPGNFHDRMPLLPQTLVWCACDRSILMRSLSRSAVAFGSGSANSLPALSQREVRQIEIDVERPCCRRSRASCARTRSDDRSHGC
jgi:hypothetical protein